MERNRKWETRSAKTKKENQLYYEEHVARRNSIRLWFATSPTTPQGIYDTKSLSGGFSRMEHGRGRLGGAWLSFQGSSSRKASFLCREQPRVESRNSVPHHSASDVLTCIRVHTRTCTEWKQCKEAWIHSVNVWVIDRSGDCRVWKGQDRGCQSSPGHGSGRRIFCDPFRSYRSAIFYSSRVAWFGFLWFDTETYSFGTSYRIVARVLLSKCCEGTLWTTHIYRLTTDMFLSV